MSSSDVLSWSFDVFGSGNLVGETVRVLEEWYGLTNAGQFVEAMKEASSRVSNGEVPAYHNFYHGTDVFFVVSHLLFRCGAAQKLSDVERQGLAVAALGHDVCHPGLNNAYHVTTNSELAIRYNDLSVLEAHSAAVTSQLVREHLGPQSRRFRQVVVGSILATDMALHSTLYDRLVNFTKRENLGTSLPDDGLFLCDVVLHLADVSNPARPSNTVPRNIFFLDFWRFRRIFF